MQKNLIGSFLIIILISFSISPAYGNNNVFLKSIFPDQKTWEQTFPVAFNNAACNGKDILSFDHLLTAAKKHPDFLNNRSKEDNVRELSAFLANVSQETTGAAPGVYNGGLCFAIETEAGRQINYCYGLTGGWDKAPLCDFGYYGRGALQISNPFNYHETSQEVFGDDRLVNEPDLLLEGDLAWEASIIFWMKHIGGLNRSDTSVQGTTTCHDAIVKNDDFGKTIEVINGNYECQNPGADFRLRTKGREEYYKSYVAMFAKQLSLSIKVSKNLDCFNGSVDPRPVDKKFRCGKNWSDANGRCGTDCNVDTDCPSGEKCFNGIDPKVCE
ncbi:MAG: hypothetical protein GY710_22985 [Desulfobacteraceae bacterium]|nr:hypothetical protein [Desulfobacteraceae bacterium]